ncbi:MAG: SRPBCC domain-containing protein [Hymenobacteraceae bacterium]|nr:SRPBCC domain-containing protein [Hymenobacteraceae bacterium]
METTAKSTPIIVEQEFNAPKQKVWEAITNLDQMTQWYFENIPDFKPEVGFKTKFVIELPERTFTHLWEVVEVEPGQQIKYLWSYEEYEGMGSVKFSLSEEGDKTTLRLTNEGLETFPADIPEFAPESCRGGWEYFIKGRLKAYLEK